MGNYLSCTITAAPSASTLAVRLVLPSGEVQRIPPGSSSSPTTAAEIMLDHPGHFVAAAASVRVGGWFAPLPADEELDMGGVYVVVPMKRVGSVVTASDAGVLFLAVTSSRRGSGQAAASAVKVVRKASPATGKGSPVGVEQEQDDKLAASVVEAAMSMARYRAMSTSRSKRPVLETIAEETAR